MQVAGMNGKRETVFKMYCMREETILNLKKEEVKETTGTYMGHLYMQHDVKIKFLEHD